MQASFTPAFAVGLTPVQATTSGRTAPCPLTRLAGPYPHISFSSALSGVRLPKPFDSTASTHRLQPNFVCFAVPASVPDSANDVAISLKPLPRAVENIADDPSLHNPLQRLHRLGPGWFGVILEYEGVLVEDTSDLHSKAWQMLGQEEGKPRPFNWALKRAEGMKSEQVHKLLTYPSQSNLCCMMHLDPDKLNFWPHVLSIQVIDNLLFEADMRRQSKKCFAGRATQWRFEG